MRGGCFKTGAHTFVTALLLRLLLLGGSSLGGSSSRRSSRSVGVGVGDAVLELLDLGPAVLGSDGDAEDLLVGVDKGVHDGGDGGEVGSERDGADGLDGGGESTEELLLADVENGVAEGLAVVVHLGDGHTVGEGRDVHHVEQGGLGGTDTAAGLDELELGGDFNGTTSNLGRDAEGLEERGLAGLHTGVAGGEVDVARGIGTSTSGGRNAVGEDLGASLAEVGVGEDQTDVACTLDISPVSLGQLRARSMLTPDVREETLPHRVVGDEALEGAANLVKGQWLG